MIFLNRAGQEVGDYTGTIAGNERLGIPTILMQDGPQGFRTHESVGGYGTTTQWPSALTVAASWDVKLLNKWATAMGEEFRDKGANVALGPGMGIARVPTAGRNFEYLCGEDPSFCGPLVEAVVSGIQKTGVIANAKHFINNEIENDRQQVSSNVDERTRFELYYPPFEAAAKAGVLSVMCSYNRINDIYACENPDTLNHLRKNLGFEGWVMSDWWATMSTSPAVKAGLDQEMPYGYWFQQSNLTNALSTGEINEADVDQSVLRILTAMYSIGLFDHPPVGDRMANVTSDAHNQVARETAAKATVLLKNTNNILPLNKQELGTCVAVIGDEVTTGGGGSGSVEPPYQITPQQGIRNALVGTNTQVLYASGLDVSAAQSLASSCDTTVLVVATNSGEGSDRETLSLGETQDTLVRSILAANPRTIVDVRTPGAVLMPWSNDVPAILISWMGGQEAGNALADVLFGVVNPSARLPVTMPNKDNEVAFTAEQYPGVGTPPEATYSEELLIGYRWYETKGVKPNFPFGFGLSYTTFVYSNLHVVAVPVTDNSEIIAKVSATLTNSNDREGSEIAQLYVQYPSEAKEPPKQLRQYQKINLRPHGSWSFVFYLTKRDISIWNSDVHAWEIVPGDYKMMIGSSSADIHLTGTFHWSG